jgi:hypothetical protein
MVDTTITSVVNCPSSEIATKTFVAATYEPIAASKTVTDTYQILATDYTIVCNKSTNFTVTLPTGVTGQKFNIKNINTGIVTVSLAGNTIDGQSSQLVYQWDCMQIQCISANTWVVL